MKMRKKSQEEINQAFSSFSLQLYHYLLDGGRFLHFPSVCVCVFLPSPVTQHCTQIGSSIRSDQGRLGRYKNPSFFPQLFLSFLFALLGTTSVYTTDSSLCLYRRAPKHINNSWGSQKQAPDANGRRIRKKFGTKKKD